MRVDAVAGASHGGDDPGFAEAFAQRRDCDTHGVGERVGVLIPRPFQKLFGGLWFLDEYKDLKIFYAPSNLNWAVTASSSRDNSLQRSEGATLITSRNFTASFAVTTTASARSAIIGG